MIFSLIMLWMMEPSSLPVSIPANVLVHLVFCECGKYWSNWCLCITGLAGLPPTLSAMPRVVALGAAVLSI
jgi:hypothetical protein